MAFNLGTAQGRIQLDTSDLARAEVSLRQAGRGMTMVGVAALAGFGVAIAASAKFEQQLSHVKAVTGATEGQIDRLRVAALKLGTDTAFGASEVAGAFVELSKAGLQVEQILNGAGDAVVQLAAAGDLPIARAAEIAVNAMQTFSLKATDMVHVADLLAGAANASTVEVEDLAVSLKYAGSVASAIGVSIEDVNSALAILGNRGIRGSTAGTSLRRILLNLSPATKSAAKTMAELGIITKSGANQLFDASGKAKDLGSVIDILARQTAGLTKEQKIASLTDIFGARAVSSILVLIDEGKKGFQEMNEQIGKVTALDVMEERLDNVAGSIKRLKATIETFLITTGGPWQETVKKFIDSLTWLIQKLIDAPPWVAQLIMSSLLLIGVLSVLSGLFLLTAGNMLRAFRLAKDMAPAFRILAGAVRMVWVAFSGLLTTLAGTAAAPFILIGLAIIALGLLLFYLYKRFDGFREFVDGIWQSVQRGWDKVLNFLKGLPERFGGIWDSIEEGVKKVLAWLGANWDIILTIFTGPLGLVVLVIRRWGRDILETIGRVIIGIIDWFQKLPGRVIGVISGIGGRIVHELAAMPERIAGILGFVLGRMIKWGIQLVVFLIRLGIDMSMAIVRFFQELPGRIIGFLNRIWDAFWAWGARLIARALEIGTQVLFNIVNFFQLLPGRVIGFLNQVWDNFYRWSTNLITRAAEIGVGIYRGIVDWVQKLPGRILSFVQSLPGLVLSIAGQMFTAALDVGKRLWNGFTSGVGDLVQWVRDAFNNILDAIGNFVGDMWDKAKSVGKSLVNGFKDGLGIGSPSEMERDMWRIVENVHKSAKDLGFQVNHVQHLDRKIKVTDLNTAPGVVSPEAGRVTPKTTPSTSSQQTNFHVETVVAQDPMTVMRETERRARLNQLVGMGSSR